MPLLSREMSRFSWKIMEESSLFKEVIAKEEILGKV